MFDGHVHAAPDVSPRRNDDVALAQIYRDAGFHGFVLKGHHESTVGRAHALSRMSGLIVVGGVTLNHAAGGINVAAVAACLQAGGRVVWMPTQDAHTQATAGLPRLSDIEVRVASSTLAVPPVDPASGSAARAVLELLADHDAVLATGHLSGPECTWLVEHSARAGVRRVLLTHPSWTVPALTPGEIAVLAEAGGHIEITAYQLLHQADATPELLAAVARAAGRRLVLTSDVGQPDSPPPPEALELLITTLAAQGLDRGLLRAAASSVPEALFVGPDPTSL